MKFNFSRSFTKDLLSYLIKEVNIASKFDSSEKPVGCYSGPKIDAKLILNSPFEIWY